MRIDRFLVQKIYRQKNGLLFLMLIVMGYFLWQQSDQYHNWKDTKRADRTLVRSDGAGYYAYLPQHLIYNDPRFSFLDSLMTSYPESKINSFTAFSPELNGRSNKYFVGVAICQIPFFVSTHLLHSSKYSNDGYSYPYQKSIAIGALFFVLFGSTICFFILVRLNISPITSIISISAFVFGSPLLFYTIIEPLASHVYSYAFIALFVWLLLRWKDKQQAKEMILLSLTLGMIVLLRPTNALVVFLFFALFDNLNQSFSFLKTHLFSSFSKLFLALIPFGLLIFTQFLSVHYQTGNWAFNLYTDEGFTNWNHPPIIEVLFGFRKGLFVYAPLCLISVLGLLYVFPKYRFQTSVVLVFFILFTYITASWWCWWYGGSNGMRPFVDFTILFIVGFAFLLDRIPIYFKWLPIAGCIFAIHYQLTFQFQLENGIVHYSEMNRERFKQVFLKRDKRFEWMFYTDQPFQFSKNQETLKTLKWNKKWNEFSFKSKNKVDARFEFEHMGYKKLTAFSADELDKKAIGIRLKGDVIFRDRNNRPMFVYAMKKEEKWEDCFYDFFGMRIPNLNEIHPFSSDWKFTESVNNMDSLSIYYDQTHGRTTIENFELQILKK